MEICFSSSRMEKVFNSDKLLAQAYGQQAKTIMLRMDALRAAPNLGAVSTEKPIRRHLLSGDRRGCFAVDLKQPYRLVFEPVDEPIPQLPDGGIDVMAIRAIRILEVVDYH